MMARERALTQSLQVRENRVRNHLASGGPLTAQESLTG